MKNNLSFIAWVILFVVFIVGPMYFVALSRTRGKVDHCYIVFDEAGSTYKLFGHRNWRSNILINKEPTYAAIDRQMKESPLCELKEDSF